MIIGGLDLHRAQITYDVLDTESGEVRRGQIAPADRPTLREWLDRQPHERGSFAVEATTGWLFVVEELARAGHEPHLAEPAETARMRGPKRRAKTDPLDARRLRTLLQQWQLPESWIPPAHIVELRHVVRLRKALVDERTAWLQRIQATLYHHGVPRPRGTLHGRDTRRWVEQVPLPWGARMAIDTALRCADGLSAQLDIVERWLRCYAERQPGCRALMAQYYGIGPILAVTIIAELGDAARFHNGREVVRYTGLDVTVFSSDGHRSDGRLSYQGPGLLRWALVEAAQRASRSQSPDHAYYAQVKERIDGGRAALSVARLLAKRIRYTLLALGDEALAPVSDLPDIHSFAA